MKTIFPNFDKTRFGFFMPEVSLPAKVLSALGINNFNPIAEEATMNAEAAKRWGFSFSMNKFYPYIFLPSMNQSGTFTESVNYRREVA